MRWYHFRSSDESPRLFLLKRWSFGNGKVKMKKKEKMKKKKKKD